MDESVVIARRRQEALDRAARILGVRPPMPSAKDEPGLREAYMAELILALAERVSGRARIEGGRCGFWSPVPDPGLATTAFPEVRSPEESRDYLVRLG